MAVPPSGAGACIRAKICSAQQSKNYSNINIFHTILLLLSISRLTFQESTATTLVLPEADQTTNSNSNCIDDVCCVPENYRSG